VVTSSLRAGRAPVSLRVPFSASSVSVARQRLRTWMGEAGSSREQVEDARVVISELVANSVRHAQPLPDGNILITWSVEPRGLQLSVTDGGGGTRPRKLHAPSSALAGRGMSIVDTLSLTWWSEKTRSRSTVHAVLAF
jgi:serine/threonine-protein kinase RsbW